MIKIWNAYRLSKLTSRYVTNKSFIRQILTCSTKNVLTHKHLRSVIKHALMNKLSYVKTKHYKDLLFLLLQKHLIIDFLIPKLTCNVHHNHLMYAINTKTIGSCRFQNILLYLVSVTNAFIMYLEVMLCYATDLSDPKA